MFDLVEPFARQLADHGRVIAGRRAILKIIGNALIVQHRVSGRVAGDRETRCGLASP